MLVVYFACFLWFSRQLTQLVDSLLICSFVLLFQRLGIIIFFPQGVQRHPRQIRNRISGEGNEKKMKGAEGRGGKGKKIIVITHTTFIHQTPVVKRE